MDVQILDYAIEDLIFKIYPNIVYDSKEYLSICDKLTNVIFNDIGYNNIKGI